MVPIGKHVKNRAVGTLIFTIVKIFEIIVLQKEVVSIEGDTVKP
jgi:hypothetical protein